MLQKGSFSVYIKAQQLVLSRQPATQSSTDQLSSEKQSMKTVLLVGMLAACLSLCYARYKTSDFTDAGENCVWICSQSSRFLIIMQY